MSPFIRSPRLSITDRNSNRLHLFLRKMAEMISNVAQGNGHNRELYRIVRPCNNRAQQQLPDLAVAMRGCCLRLIKLHEGVLVLVRLIQVFTAVVNELIKRL